ncbi:Tripartite motif-containing protein 56 [Aphelenchoides avenae]|nr:Tripartite motif-containing protein 56 [Aphelenchus avenae]
MLDADEEDEVRPAGTSATAALPGRKSEAKDETKAKASECPVCLDTYVDPRVLPACGHTVCHSCVRKLIHAPPNRTTVACPECRETSNVPKTGFPKNYRLSGQ